MAGHRVLRVAGQVGKVAIAVAAVSVIGLTWFGSTVFHQVSAGMTTDSVIANHAPSSGTQPTVPKVSGRDMNFLLVGMDSRTDVRGNPLPQSVLDGLNAGTDDGEINTDTLILVHVPGDGSRASAVSIPRDSYVDIAGGFGKHKINSAFAYGMNAAGKSLTEGRKNVIATVEQLTGVTIDHYAEVNLYGFYQVSQALGGVPVCLKNPVDDSYSGAHFGAGPQTLSGLQALQFVRQRHGLTNGDLDREARQQAFLASAVHQLLSVGTFTDPGKLNAIITAVQNSVLLDQNWNLLQFAEQMQGITGNNITFATIPIVNISYWTPADGDAVEVDPASVRQFVASAFSGSAQPPAKSQPPVKGTPSADPITKSTTSNDGPITADGVTCVN